MKTNLRWLLIVAPVLAWAQPPDAAPKPAPAKPAPAKPAAAKPAAAPVKPAVAPAKPAREPGTYAYFTITQGATTLGTIVTRMYAEESPITVKNFADLAMGRKEWTSVIEAASASMSRWRGVDGAGSDCGAVDSTDADDFTFCTPQLPFACRSYCGVRR